MKFITLLALLFIGCAPDGGDVNVADNGSEIGDPVTETTTNTGCGESEDNCGADF